MPNGRVEKQTGVDPETLLSVPVSLTDGSAKVFQPNAKSIAGQTVRLKKDCITLLRAFVVEHRSDLLAEDDDQPDEDS